MNSEVIVILKNFRYNLIRIDEDYYILDRDKPYVLVYFLPFIYWMLPKRVTKISAQSAQQLQTVSLNNTDTGGSSFVYASISMTIANFLAPLAYMFEIDVSPVLASFIVFLLLSSALYFRFTVSKSSKHSLMRQLRLQDHRDYCLMWVVPRSLKVIAMMLFMCPVLLFMISGTIYGFLKDGSLFILFLSTFFFILLLFMNIVTVLPGKGKMRFWVRKKKKTESSILDSGSSL
ncbi:DUF443 family protein [Terribacillus goriensis]|uniref:DUF443 family protein n=1 Tax=Terribacillus saccharophilus TaxID=361277 RepID=UPI0039836C34